MDKLPKFIGRSLIETPDVPMIGYLKGEFGKAFLERYNTVIDEKYSGNEMLKVLEFGGNVVKGSSTYSSVIAAGVLRQSGLEVAKPADIEFARKLHSETNGICGLNTKERYFINYGVAYRSNDESNEYHAEKLEPQIKKVLGIKEITEPIVILSGDMDVINDENGPNGLGLHLNKEAKPFAVPALKRECRFSKTDINGMPVPYKKRIKGDRRCYISLIKGDRRATTPLNNTGLYGIVLDYYLGFCSCQMDLAESVSDGRLVAVKK